MAFDKEKVKQATRLLLEGIGDNPDRDGLKDTPSRVANAYAETLNGYELEPENYVTEFENDGNYQGFVALREAELYSLCEHHLAPFFGELDVIYKPNKKIVGLSKLLRIARVYAKRPQVQERLTQEIADAINDILEPEWCVVRYKAEHYCMRLRGTRVKQSYASTIAGHGNWPDNVFDIS